jgi:glycerol-3-phosphate dehydrogenase
MRSMKSVKPVESMISMGSAKSFSALERSIYLEQMSSVELDLLIIGGGITGAGIALDATVRGMKVGLIEMQDFAAGTSSRSTKLIHGGLRYLKQLEFKLVAEVGKERAIVYENAPHVTTPEWMLLPIIEGGTYGKWATSLGLKLYDFLAGVNKSEHRKMLNREQTLEKEPLLRKDKLKGGGLYVEYRTDDARLTIEILKAAVDRGTRAANYAKAEDFIYEGRKLIGVRVVDQITGQMNEIRAKKFVNAAGPWVDILREIDGSKRGKSLHLTKGVHIVIDGRRFPLKQAIYFDTPDGRMMFAIPRDGKTYVGTTDTTYQGNLEHPLMTVEDRDYILQAANVMFPLLKLRPQDVESSWAGLRPLIHENGKSPSELSRKDEIFHSDSGLITIAGGKLTGYRKMAERVVDRVTSELEQEGFGPYSGYATDAIVLSGGDVGGSEHFGTFVEEKKEQGSALGLSRQQAKKWVHRYGSNVDRLFEIVSCVRQQHQAEELPLPMDVLVPLIYGMEHEMVVTPLDYFVRRIGALYFDIDWVKQWKEPVIEYMRLYFGWSNQVTEDYREALERCIREVASPVEGI